MTNPSVGEGKETSLSAVKLIALANRVLVEIMANQSRQEVNKTTYASSSEVLVMSMYIKRRRKRSYNAVGAAVVIVWPKYLLQEVLRYSTITETISGLSTAVIKNTQD